MKSLSATDQLSPQVWVVDDDRPIRSLLENALRQAFFETRSFDGARSLLKALEQGRPDVILANLRIPGLDGLALLRKLLARHAQLPVIAMTADADLEFAVSAFRHGAFEYLPKPFDMGDAVSLVRRACMERGPWPHRLPPMPQKIPEIVSEAPAMQEVLRIIARLARSHIGVLITGEAGTGKESVARALHRRSPRSDKPFIAVNMAALPYHLVESELFGHDLGTYGRRPGCFEQADGGTLFLDEIDDMPLDLQGRLLRAMVDGEIFSAGDRAPTKVDVRIIAASRRNLEALVAWGRFREDLYHRLGAVRLRLPPLRERREDIPPLLRHFLAKAGRELSAETKVLRPEVEAYLCRLDWPGNVRELEDACRRISVMAADREIHLGDLPPELLEMRPQCPPTTENWQDVFRHWVDRRFKEGDRNFAKESIKSAESILIIAALKMTQGCKQDAARLLGCGRNTLARKIDELNLEV